MAKKRKAHDRAFKKMFGYKPNRNHCYVYVVIADGEIRYCGQTRVFNVVEKSKWIIRGARKNPTTPFHNWILDRQAKGLPWDVQIVDRHGQWDVSEILWIQKLRDEGHRLLNVLRGGKDSISYPISDALRRTKIQRQNPHFAHDDNMAKQHMLSIFFEGRI